MTDLEALLGAIEARAKDISGVKLGGPPLGDPHRCVAYTAGASCWDVPRLLAALRYAMTHDCRSHAFDTHLAGLLKGSQ